MIKNAKTRGAKSQRYTLSMTAVEVSRTIDRSIAAHVDRTAAAAPTTPKLYTLKCDVPATRPFCRTSCGLRAADARRPTASDHLATIYTAQYSQPANQSFNNDVFNV